MIVALALSIAVARELERSPRPIAPPEADFLVRDGSLDCDVDVVVGPDGRAIGAEAAACPAVFDAAVRAAALTARWVEAAEQTVESVSVRVRRPARAPRTYEKGVCLVFVAGGSLRFGGEDRRCRFDFAAFPQPRFPAGVKSDAWCGVDVVAGPEGVTSLDAGDCAGWLAPAVIDGVRGWGWDVELPTRFRVVVEVDQPRRVIDFD